MTPLTRFNTKGQKHTDRIGRKWRRNQLTCQCSVSRSTHFHFVGSDYVNSQLDQLQLTLLRIRSTKKVSLLFKLWVIVCHRVWERSTPCFRSFVSKAGNIIGFKASGFKILGGGLSILKATKPINQLFHKPASILSLEWQSDFHWILFVLIALGRKLEQTGEREQMQRKQKQS